MGVWSDIAATVMRDGHCALVTVAEVSGSAPREAGARLLVTADGGFRGTIGGGALEWEIVANARKALQARQPSARLSRHALGPELGQCCGGSVRLLVEVFDEQSASQIEQLAEQERKGPFATRGQISSKGVRRNILDSATPAAGVSLELADTIIESFGKPHRTVVLFGAGHVGRALMMALAPLPFEIVWVDQRPDQFPTVMPANVIPRCVQDVTEQVTRAPRGSFAVVMTHSHPLDLGIVHAALESRRFDYIGLIGSDTKRARFSSRLREAGLGEQLIEQLVCPIGIEGIDSKEPAAIAVSVAAQLMAYNESNRVMKTGGRGRRRASSTQHAGVEPTRSAR